jgi:2-keto-3-deoxy-L-rhamnonate aldolase RhmA
MSQGRITPLARVAVGSIEHIKQALDCGAQGIIVPMVNTAEQARDAVRFARFPPVGERGGGGLAAHLGFGVSRPVYMAQANAEILVGIQIETVEALENLDAILDVPGIDMIFIGPNDLHLSLGLPAMFWSDHAPFQDAIAKIRAGCASRGLPLGTLCRDAGQARARTSEGMTFIGLGSDAHFLLTYSGQEFGAFSGEPEPPESWCHTLRTFKPR